MIHNKFTYDEYMTMSRMALVLGEHSVTRVCAVLAMMAMAHAYRNSEEGNYMVGYDDLSRLTGGLVDEALARRLGGLVCLAANGDVSEAEAADEGLDLTLWWDDDLGTAPKEYWFKDELGAEVTE